MLTQRQKTSFYQHSSAFSSAFSADCGVKITLAALSLALPLTGERKAFPVVQTRFNEELGQLSRDGRWIASIVAGGSIVIGGLQEYDVSADGQRLLINMTVSEAAASPRSSTRVTARVAKIAKEILVIPVIVAIVGTPGPYERSRWLLNRRSQADAKDQA